MPATPVTPATPATPNAPVRVANLQPAQADAALAEIATRTAVAQDAAGDLRILDLRRQVRQLAALARRRTRSGPRGAATAWMRLQRGEHLSAATQAQVQVQVSASASAARTPRPLRVRRSQARWRWSDALTAANAALALPCCQAAGS